MYGPKAILPTAGQIKTTGGDEVGDTTWLVV
jgi:hypothetical protein